MKNHIKTESLVWETGKVKGFSGKNLINLENGGLKMVRVKAQSNYPTHLHPEKTEYIYVIEGSPKITIGEVNYNGVKGDFFILPNAIKHSIENNTDEECQLLVGAIKV